MRTNLNIQKEGKTSKRFGSAASRIRFDVHFFNEVNLSYLTDFPTELILDRLFPGVRCLNKFSIWKER